MCPLIISSNAPSSPNYFPCSTVFLTINIDVRVNPEFDLPFLGLYFYCADVGFFHGTIGDLNFTIFFASTWDENSVAFLVFFPI